MVLGPARDVRAGLGRTIRPQGGYSACKLFTPMTGVAGKKGGGKHAWCAGPVGPPGKIILRPPGGARDTPWGHGVPHTNSHTNPYSYSVRRLFTGLASAARTD